MFQFRFGAIDSFYGCLRVIGLRSFNSGLVRLIAVILPLASEK